MQLVLVGLENTGKTTLLYRLKFGQYMHTQPTVGFNCEKVEGRWGKAKGVLFSIWDVEGKDNMRPLWKSYLRWVSPPRSTAPPPLPTHPHPYPHPFLCFCLKGCLACLWLVFSCFCFIPGSINLSWVLLPRSILFYIFFLRVGFCACGSS